MKIKKIVALSVGLMTIGSSILATGCGSSGSKVVNDDTTINVVLNQSGNGSGWLLEIADKFEDLYKDQGYKVNLLDPRTGFTGKTALAEMRLGTATGVDLWLTSGVSVADALDEDYGACVENLTDVYNSKPINFDGTEGEKTLEELYNNENEWAITDTNGDFYSYSPTTSIRGIVCNTKVLSQYGITQMPRTSNELFEAFDAVLYGANGKKGSAFTGVYPTTWGGDNAYGYALYSLYTNLAQMMGVEAYDEFFKLDVLLENDNALLADGYSLYEGENAEAMKAALEVFIQQYDTAYSTAGSATQRHDDAHGKIIMGNAAFMTDGEFFFNEVRVNFNSKLNDVTFINTPVISKLGIQLKLDGSGSDEAKCDDILSYMIGLIDEGKNTADIKSATETQFSVTLTDAQVERVLEARKVGFQVTTAGGYVTKGSKKADVAKLFLRMLASEDASNVYAKYGMLSAYSKTNVNSYEYDFTKGAARINNFCDYFVHTEMYPGTLRAKIGPNLMSPYTATMVTKIPEKIGAVTDPKTQRNYEELSANLYGEIQNHWKNNWKTELAKAGIEL